MNDKPKIDRYSLSSSNKVYFCVIAILSGAAFLLRGEMGPERIGYLVGSLMTMFLISLAIAWIVWLVTGRRKSAGSWTFNILLTLILLGQTGQTANRAKQETLVEEKQDQKTDNKQNESDSEGPEESSSATHESSDSVQNDSDEVQAATPDAMETAQSVAKELIYESRDKGLKWTEAFSGIQEERILDYSVLNSDEEFTYQKATVKQYVEDAQAYEMSILNFTPELDSRLAGYADSEMVKAIKRGAQDGFGSQTQSLLPLLKAHIQYGTSMLEVLELLQQNRDSWTYEDDELSVADEDFLNRFNAIIERIGEAEDQINTLAEKVARTLTSVRSLGAATTDLEEESLAEGQYVRAEDVWRAARRRL